MRRIIGDLIRRINGLPMPHRLIVYGMLSSFLGLGLLMANAALALVFLNLPWWIPSLPLIIGIGMTLVGTFWSIGILANTQEESSKDPRSDGPGDS